MITDDSNSLDVFWGGLLSGQPERVQAAFTSLGETEQQAVLAHLLRMANEPGWQPEQRESAQLALRILQE